MSTNEPKAPVGGPSAPLGTGPGQFTEAEVAAVAEGPATDPELDELEAADIDAEEPETPFVKVQATARRLSADRVRTVVESILFVADRPLTVDQIFEATGIDREKVLAGLQKLQGQLREGVSGVILQEVGGGWQLRTAPDSAEFVKRFLKVKPQRLTRAAVETLAIIAYRQPVTRPEVEDIRGVDSGAVIKALLERRMIRILGKKEEVGRPILYGTSREFLEFFALKDLSSLPTLREFHELSEEHQQIVEKETPAPAAAGTVEELSDPEFKARLDQQNAASEAALVELEAAISGADVTAKAAATLLGTASPQVAPVPPSEPPAV